jgi:hypothetical protein
MKLSKLMYITFINHYKNTILFTDNQVIIAVSEDNLWRGVFILQNIVKDFGMEISPEKSEMMAFLGQDPVSCKFIVDNKCLQVKNFKYLNCEISYENEKDINQKPANFSQTLLNQLVFQKYSRIKVYNTLALPVFLYGSEIWTLRQKDKRQLTSIKMQFFRSTVGYTLFDHKRNEESFEKLKVEPVEKVRRYKSNWLQHDG